DVPAPTGSVRPPSVRTEYPYLIHIGVDMSLPDMRPGWIRQGYWSAPCASADPAQRFCPRSWCGTRPGAGTGSGSTHTPSGLGRAGTVPMVVHDAPHLTGVQLDSATTSSLRELEGVAGVKFTSKDMPLLERAVANHPDKTYIGGFDETLVSAMAAGATGAIGTPIGLQFELFARRRLYAGNLADAQQV